MRRVSASLGGLALATGLFVMPASAAPSSRFADTQWELFCNLESEAGTVFVEIFASERFAESFAGLDFTDAEAPPDSGPTWIAIDGSASFTGTSVSATFDLVEFDQELEDPIGDPVGTATLDATLVPAGDPSPYTSNPHGQGNRNDRREGVVSEFGLAGSLVLPEGISFTLTPDSSCVAIRDTFSQVSNSPASSVDQGADLDLFCAWEVEGAFVNLFAFNFGDGMETGLDVSMDDELRLFGIPTSEPVFTNRAFSASYDLFEPTEGELEDPVGSATASGALTREDRFHEFFRDGRRKEHFIVTTYAVDGMLSLTTPDGTLQLPMDEESCSASQVHSVEQERPAPKGKPIPNDAPEDAVPIGIGDTVMVRTGHTDPAPEEPCADEFGELFIGHTAWWTFDGTGGDVTIDTAGSDFDTVVGVYIDEAGALVPIGCVDDTEEGLQAKITVATEAGVTYWIQAGGFADNVGNLVLSVE